MDERYLLRPEPGVIRAAEAIDEVIRSRVAGNAERLRDVTGAALALAVWIDARERVEAGSVVPGDSRAAALDRKTFEGLLGRYRAAYEAWMAPIRENARAVAL